MDLRRPAQVSGSSARSLGDGKGRLQFDLRPAPAGQSPRGKLTMSVASGGEAITHLTQRSENLSDAGSLAADAMAGKQVKRVNEAVASALVLPPPRRSDRRTVIAVDAGHGGIDPGATGARGTTEKTITLASARELKRQLEATGRFSVVMTRESDVYVPLRERVEIARTAGAQLFVSLHADQHDSARLRGASIYTLSETASDAETEAYAQRENNSDVVAGVALAEEYDAEVAQILFSLVQQSTMNCSAVFAATLVNEISQRSRMVPKAHRFAGFRVLKAPDVPSVLIELGYLSNGEDERLLSSAKQRTALMRAVARAVSLYFDSPNC
jgi:N-acetylmuramoyl-L-alanine amidase